MFILGPCASFYGSCENQWQHTSRTRRRRVVHMGAGALLFLGTPTIIVPKHNKTGMKSVPRSLWCFWLKHYIFFVMFYDFDKYQCCFCIFGGGASLFSCNQLFPLFYICFITFFCIKQKFSYFCILFSCGKLDCICYFFVPSICSCLGDKGGERAAIAVRVSSFQFFFQKKKS